MGEQAIVEDHTTKFILKLIDQTVVSGIEYLDVEAMMVTFHQKVVFHLLCYYAHVL